MTSIAPTPTVAPPPSSERGMAMLTAILVLMLASGLMAGMFAAVLADQRSHQTDRDQTQAYAAAHAGLEKLTSTLGLLFEGDFSPSASQLDVLDNYAPSITGFTYTAPGGSAGSGYAISFNPDPGPGPNTGNPMASPNNDITTGPFEGLKGLITPYTITVTARSTTGNSEVRLRREIQTVAVPVFQFGIFGEKTIGFHAGPNFDFGGRVHTNEKLFLASGGGSTLTFRDKITAFDEVKRDHLMNGISITATGHGGSVSIPTVIGGPPASYRNLASTENSGTTAAPWTGWDNLSKNVYQANIRTEATGAKRLRLPLATAGAAPIDLIRRPAVNSNENVANKVVFDQRYFSQASVRILLSDRPNDILNLPTVTATAPILLDGDWNAAPPAGYVVGAGRPALARAIPPDPSTLPAGATYTRASVINAGASSLTIQTAPAPGGPWTDGVPEWLRVPTNGFIINGTAVTCTGFTTAIDRLTGCGAHPAFAVGNVVSITFEGQVRTTTVRTAAAANSGNIDINVFGTGQAFRAAKTFYVGEDPVSCTSYTTTQLNGCLWNGATLTANDPVYNGSTLGGNRSTIGGYIKIEKQNSSGVWSDVTLELLNLGFAGPNLQGNACADPTPNAVLRIQRLRDSGLGAGGCTGAASTNYAASTNGLDYYPNMIFDTREGNTRLLATGADLNLGGLFSYVALDANNFRRWVTGALGGTGSQVLNNNGYIIYFSDRRGNHNPTAAVPDAETGEYGFEDSLNPTAAAWAKDNVLNGGEDFNENNTLQSYGETPHILVTNGLCATWAACGDFLAPFNGTTARPWTTLARATSGQGRMARQTLFRRALKVVNGGLNNLPNGFTVASENPVFIHGNFNANSTDVTAEPNMPTAIIADAITLLSNAWNDTIAFRFPNDMTNRNANDTGYRFAMITGKAVPFNKPAAWGVNELGSDGGVHNFMRMLEDWSGTTLRYRGSMVSLFFSRQAINMYRADANVYSPPTRGYNFDTDFLTPALLPPGTPMFRDVNTLKFRQILRPNQ